MAIARSKYDLVNNYKNSEHTGIGFNTRRDFYPDLDLNLIIAVNDNIDQDKVSELEKAIKMGLK